MTKPYGDDCNDDLDSSEVRIECPDPSCIHGYIDVDTGRGGTNIAQCPTCKGAGFVTGLAPRPNDAPVKEGDRVSATGIARNIVPINRPGMLGYVHIEWDGGHGDVDSVPLEAVASRLDKATSNREEAFRTVLECIAATAEDEATRTLASAILNENGCRTQEQYTALESLAEELGVKVTKLMKRNAHRTDYPHSNLQHECQTAIAEASTAGWNAAIDKCIEILVEEDEREKKLKSALSKLREVKP